METHNNYLLDLDNAEKKIWQLLLQGTANKKSSFHCPTLSTLGEQGVNLRTLILRQVIVSTRSLIFFTDNRSKKVLDIKFNENVVLHIYDSKNKLQIQLYGKAVVEKYTKNAKTTWQNLNNFSKKNYMSLLPPGSKIYNLKELEFNKIDNEGPHYQFY